MTAALDRGLDFAGVQQMELGAIVDFCIEYNEMHKSKDSGSENENNNAKPKVRKATQADWDALAG